MQFWVAKEKRYVGVYMEVIAYLMDQPERRSVTHIMAGNATHHPCFGYSFERSLVEKLPAAIATQSCATLVVMGHGVAASACHGLYPPIIDYHSVDCLKFAKKFLQIFRATNAR
jgi:hypothetical protein